MSALDGRLHKGARVETYRRRVDILADAAHVDVDTNAALVDLLGVNTVSRMQVCDLAIREDAVDLVVSFELVPELCTKSKALLLACKLEQVGALPHDGCTSGGHLEDLLLLALPCDDIELLNLKRGNAISAPTNECASRLVSFVIAALVAGVVVPVPSSTDRQCCLRRWERVCLG
jgi:hypothetical protein